MTEWGWPAGSLRVAAICGRRVLLDNWEVRRWLLWPWCALRRHRDTFWLAVRWNGVVTEEVARCSCGRRMRRYPVGGVRAKTTDSRN
jgi:hypothetical protein